ncbi:MAG: glycosyltransferase family 4 protein [Candidatus Latescibacteria bacterium]|nr:glycosyltransferase family 4 protein [Candidatus Latescibacterota bacterium]
MNVLVFTTLFPNNVSPNHGVFVKARVQSFARREGQRVRVVSPVPVAPPFGHGTWRQFSQIRRENDLDGLPVMHPRYALIPKVGMTLHGYLMYRSVLPSVRRLRKRFPFDLIDAHYVYPDGFAAALLGRALEVPVVVSARGTDINLFREFPIIRLMVQWTLRSSAHVIAVSAALKGAMVDLGAPAAKITVIPNGVDGELFRPIARADAAERVGLPGGRMILSVGALLRTKGFDLILRAFRSVRDERPFDDVTLVIVGEGPERRPLEALAERLRLTPYVRFQGSVPHVDLPTWYSAADVACMGTVREGWPNVVLESMACGTPVVAPAVGGIPEIIRSPETGILVERTERSVAEGLSAALSRAWNRDFIRTYALGHGWDETGRSVERVFEGVLARR